MRSVPATTALVLAGDVLEEERHGLLVVDSTDRFREHRADIDRLDLVALHLLDLVRNRVCHDDLN